MTSIKTTTTEIITIEEAIHDYKQAYDDYEQTIEKANKYYTHDKEVLTAQLEAYFKHVHHITIIGNTARIFYTSYKPDILEIIKILHDINQQFSIEFDKENLYITIDLFKEA